MSDKLGPATIAVIVLSAYIALIILILLVKHLTRVRTGYMNNILEILQFSFGNTH